MTGRLKQQIRQKRPFTSIQEEVVLSMLRTADRLASPVTDVLRESGLSLSQYNILRILRGAGEEGRTCGEISERMVRRDPDLTRLLDRLEARGLVRRARSAADRRVVQTTLTDEGLRVLDELDAPIEAATKQALAHVPASRLKTLRDLLDEARGEE